MNPPRRRPLTHKSLQRVVHLTVQRMMGRGSFTLNEVCAAVWHRPVVYRVQRQRVREIVWQYIRAGYLKVRYGKYGAIVFVTAIAASATLEQADAREMITEEKRSPRATAYNEVERLLQGLL
jgi:hypothetical protein